MGVHLCCLQGGAGIGDGLSPIVVRLSEMGKIDANNPYDARQGLQDHPWGASLSAPCHHALGSSPVDHKYRTACARSLLSPDNDVSCRCDAASDFWKAEA